MRLLVGSLACMVVMSVATTSTAEPSGAEEDDKQDQLMDQVPLESEQRAFLGSVVQDHQEVRELVQDGADENAAGVGHGYGYGFAIHTDHSEQYSARDESLADGVSEPQHQYVKRLIVTKAVPYAVPQPYPVTVEKRVPFAVKVPVHIPVDKPYEVAVLKPYPVPVDRPVPYAVAKPVPYPVKVAVKVPVAQPVAYEVAKPYAVHVPVVKPYKVAVPVYFRAKEHGNKGEYAPAAVKYLPVATQHYQHHQARPEPLHQHLQQHHQVGGYSVEETPVQGEDHGDDEQVHQQVGGYTEQRAAYAASDMDAVMEARLADVRVRGGSYSYVYRH